LKHISEKNVCEAVYQIQLAQKSGQLRNFVNSMINFCVIILEMQVISLPAERMSTFQEYPCTMESFVMLTETISISKR
jgi:hypothetical protein